MSEETPIIEDDMGNIVSGGKDLLSSSLHWPEGTEEEKSGESLPGKEEQPGTTESETVPEQSSGGDQQQPTGDREEPKPEDPKPSSSISPELQHDRSAESDGSGGGGERDKQQQQQQRDESSIWDFLIRDIIRKQCEAWDNLTKGGQSDPSEDEGDLTIEVEEEEYHPIVKDDLTILDMFIIKPESVKIKNRNNKKKNKKKKWLRSKKQRKPNGKMHYIIL